MLLGLQFEVSAADCGRRAQIPPFYRHKFVPARRKILPTSSSDGTTFFHVVDSNHTMTVPQGCLALPQGSLEAASRQPRGSLTEATWYGSRKNCSPNFLHGQTSWPGRPARPLRPATQARQSEAAPLLGAEPPSPGSLSAPRLLALHFPAARSPLPCYSLSAPLLAQAPLPGSLSARSPLPCSLSAPRLALHATQARRARAVTYVAAALRRWAGTVRLRYCAAARQDQRAHLEPSIRTLPSMKMESQSTEVDSRGTRIRWIREEQSGRFPEKVTCIFVLAVCNVFIQ